MNKFFVSCNIVIPLSKGILINQIGSVNLNEDVSKVCAEPGGPPLIKSPVLVVVDNVKGNLIKKTLNMVIRALRSGDVVEVSSPNVFSGAVKMIAELVD